MAWAQQYRPQARIQVEISLMKISQLYHYYAGGGKGAQDGRAWDVQHHQGHLLRPLYNGGRGPYLLV